MAKLITINLYSIFLFVSCVSLPFDKNETASGFTFDVNPYQSRRNLFIKLINNEEHQEYNKNTLYDNLDHDQQIQWATFFRLRSALDKIENIGCNDLDLLSLSRCLNVAIERVEKINVIYTSHLKSDDNGETFGREPSFVANEISYLGSSYDIPSYLYPFNRSTLNSLSAWDILMIINRFHNVSILFVFEDENTFRIILNDSTPGSGVNNLWPKSWW